MAKYRKIPMRASNILDFLYQFIDPDSGVVVSNDFNIKDTQNHPATPLTSNINIGPNFGDNPDFFSQNIIQSPNLLQNMFDGKYSTCYSLAGHANDGSSYFTNNDDFCQFTYDFGRPINPRQVKLTTHCQNNFSFQFYFLNDLNQPNLTYEQNLPGFGDPDFIGGSLPYYNNILVQDDGTWFAGIVFGYNGNQFNNPWNYGRDPGLPAAQIGFPGTVRLVDDFGTSVQNLSQHVKGFGGFNHATRPMKDGFYDGYQFMMVRLIGGDTANAILNNPTISYGNPTKIVGIEVFEEVFEKDFNVEFDDALLDLNGWRNTRYYGSKLTSRRINKFTPSGSNTLVAKGKFDGIDDLDELADVFIDNNGQFQDKGILQGMLLKNVSTGEMETIRNVLSQTELQLKSGFNESFQPAGTAQGGDGTQERNLYEIYKKTNYPDWKGDISFGKNPVLENQTTALYIANTVVGGKEDEQFATIKGHSYVGINKILLINKRDNSVQILDKEAEGFNEFNRFITKDFPAGSSANCKVIDESIANNLKSEYHIKMNKGYLLKSFNYKFNGQIEPDENGINGLGQTSDTALNKNTMFLYKRAYRTFDLQSSQGMSPLDDANLPGENFHMWGVDQTQTEGVINPNAPLSVPIDLTQDPGVHDNLGNEELCFTFASIIDNEDIFESGTSLDSPDDLLPNTGPMFNSSSIIKNKFTTDFHTRRFGFLNDEVELGGVASFTNTIFGQTVEFLCSSSLNYSIENDVELYCTFLEGDKDFAPGTNDERSIGTFQIDPQRTLDKLRFSTAEAHLPGINVIPKLNELTFKGKRDTRFLPTLNPFFTMATTQYYSAGWLGTGAPYDVKLPSDNYPTQIFPIVSSLLGYFTINIFNPEENEVSGSCYLMVGNNGQDYQQGFSSGYVLDNFQAMLYSTTFASFKPENFYSGSIEAKFGKSGCEAFQYDVSFLDRDHTLIMDIDKPTELFDGIGDQGLVIIPEFLDRDIRKNVEFYLQKAGIVEATTSTTSPPSPDL